MKRAMPPLKQGIQKMFKEDTYKFEASKELLMCMPFDFIDGLKDKKWTRIDQKWLARLMRHLKKAQSSNIKQIRFIRHIGRLDQTPPPPSAGTTKSQRRVGTRKRPKKKPELAIVR